jgi:hypothetical protein
LGTIFASTTLIQGVPFHGAKVFGGGFDLVVGHVVANWIMRFVLFLRGSALLRFPCLKSFIVWMKYSVERPLTPAFSARPLPWG